MVFVGSGSTQILIVIRIQGNDNDSGDSDPRNCLPLVQIGTMELGSRCNLSVWSMSAIALFYT